MRGLAGLAILAVVTALTSGLAHSAPEPSIVPVAWQFDVDYQSPMSIQLRLPGETQVQTYWYVLYTVTNNTGEDRYFVPNLTLYADTGQIIRAGRGVSPAVFDAIKRRHNNPLLKDPTSINAPLLQGEDNAQDGVAIFRDIDPKARSFEIYFAGLSGETVTVKLPVPIETVEEADGKTEKVTKDSIVLRKTLQLSYGLPGEAAARLTNPPRLLASQWVMR